MTASRAYAGLAVLALLPAAVPAAAQEYFEPPRREGVTLPPEVWQRSRAAAEALGIPSPDAFVSGAAAGVVLDRTGELPVLVIPARFADSPEPDVSVDRLQEVLFDGPSPAGTVGEYFHAMSGGDYDVSGTVTEWVQSSITLEEAAGSLDGHGWFGPRLRDHVREALRAIDATIDFGDFDSDGPDGVANSTDDDGFVDAVSIKFPEVAGSCGGPGPWPHTGSARKDGFAFETDDTRLDGSPIRIAVYTIDSVVECDGETVQGIQVLAHELGHVIGLPDLYRSGDRGGREYRHWTVGCFGLMGAGAWGCGTGSFATGFGPSGLTPLMKHRLGWLTFDEVAAADSQEFVLEPVQTSRRALRVPLSPGSDEAFIIEYRPRTGFDEWLPAGGVLVYHHDEFAGTQRLRPTPDSLPPAYGYHLVEADGGHALRTAEVNGGDRGVVDDIFAVDGGPDAITDQTLPSTRDHLGGTSTLTIHSITVEADVARVVLSVGSGFHVSHRAASGEVIATDPYEGRLELADGTAPFGVELVAGGLPEGVSVSAGDSAITVAGSPLEVGTFEASLLIADADGRTIGGGVRLIVDDAPLDPDVVAEALAGAPHTPLVSVHRRYLDLSGNRNDAFDVGDMRAFLLRTQGSP